MSEVIIFDKKTQTQNLVEGPEVTLQTASVVIVNAGQLSVRQMTRSGDSLIIDFLDKKRLAIKKFFDDRHSKENSLVFNDNGQLTEAVIQEPALANQPLGVSYEPFQQSAQNAQGADSVLGKISSSFSDLSPLTKGALLGDRIPIYLYLYVSGE